jgi:hypothetical protein
VPTRSGWTAAMVDADLRSLVNLNASCHDGALGIRDELGLPGPRHADGSCSRRPYVRQGRGKAPSSRPHRMVGFLCGSPHRGGNGASPQGAHSDVPREPPCGVRPIPGSSRIIGLRAPRWLCWPGPVLSRGYDSPVALLGSQLLLLRPSKWTSSVSCWSDTRARAPLSRRLPRMTTGADTDPVRLRCDWIDAEPGEMGGPDGGFTPRSERARSDCRRCHRSHDRRTRPSRRPVRLLGAVGPIPLERVGPLLHGCRRTTPLSGSPAQ